MARLIRRKCDDDSFPLLRPRSLAALARPRRLQNPSEKSALRTKWGFKKQPDDGNADAVQIELLIPHARLENRLVRANGKK